MFTSTSDTANRAGHYCVCYPTPQRMCSANTTWRNSRCVSCLQCVVIGNMRAIGRWSVCAFMWLCCCDDLIVGFVDISRNEQRPVARVLRFLGMWHPRRLFAVVLATATILLISLFERSVVLCELGRFGIDQAARQHISLHLHWALGSAGDHGHDMWCCGRRGC